MEHSYTPYAQKHHERKKFKFPKIKLPKSLKLWVGIIVAVIFAVFFMFYLLLGQLRFFANHFLGLTFFSKNYLIVMQNNYELRPGGGFITGYGNMDFVMGIPTEMSFKNSYDIDTDTYITPPYPHEELLKNEWYQGYSFRDANWDPDFPESAATLIDFYQKKFPEKKVDGIVVVNFSLIESLIDKLGGIDINGKHLDKNNLFSELEFEVNNVDRHNIDALQNRKNILGDLAGSLIGKAKKHPFKARDIIAEGLNNKEIFLWLSNKRLEEKLKEKGWANDLSIPERSDFLHVNLANLGSKKADRYLQTDVNYYANIRKEVPEITTEVTIRYPGFTNTYSDNYKGYLRLYIPKSASTGNLPVDSIEETVGNFKVIGMKVILPAGSKTNLTFSYTLPRNLFELDQFKLHLAKQSGSEFNYSVTVEGPEGKLMESNRMEARENRARFRGKLKNDLDLSVKLLPDSLPPYAIEQEFISLDQINIVWNEPVSETNARNLDAYNITDLNQSNAATDVVKIKSIDLVQPNIVKLELEGVTDQNEEFYRVDIKNLTDLAGNQIIPNPKTLTVVQRIKPISETPEIKLGEIPDVEAADTEVPAQ